MRGPKRPGFLRRAILTLLNAHAQIAYEEWEYKKSLEPPNIMARIKVSEAGNMVILPLKSTQNETSASAL